MVNEGILEGGRSLSFRLVDVIHTLVAPVKYIYYKQLY